jgi:hypothetical protein
MKHEFTCSQCCQQIAHEDKFSTGYGIDKDGHKVCFACCGVNDAKELETMPIKGKTILYLDTKAKTLSNWPGTFKIQLHYIREGRHNIAGKRYDAWFNYKGNEFHAVQYGNNTQIAHVKRIVSN